jgi:hypothetical protein
MNKYPKIQATIKIAEKVTLLAVGAAALIVSVVDPKFATLKIAVQASGALCLLLSLSPMIWAYCKNNWPVDKKK